jgi:hypothetical protein
MEITLEYVENLATKLPAEDQKLLIERLENKLEAPEKAGGKQLRSLRGIWQGKVSEDFDVEAALREIRQEWMSELEEFK